MMTNQPMMIIFLIALISMPKQENPIFYITQILVTALLSFTYMSWKSGTTWYPLILGMIFVGGILMMFMIMSSILPNQNSKSMKKMGIIISVSMIISIMMTMSSIKSVNQSLMTPSFMKTNMYSTSNMMILTILILMYFTSFIFLISKEETPMRTLMCR